MVAVSYATAAPEYERISGLTYETVTDEHRAESRSSWDRRDVIASAAVLVMIAIAYLYFRG
jgi:SSS family solute:Na+ symporter